MRFTIAFNVLICPSIGGVTAFSQCWLLRKYSIALVGRMSSTRKVMTGMRLERARSISASTCSDSLASAEKTSTTSLDALMASKLVVLVFSADANESEQVLAEIERARSKRIPVITFRVEDILPTKAMEYFLSSQHWLNAVTPPIEGQIKTLNAIVKRMAEADYAPARVAEIGRSDAPWNPPGRPGISRRAAIIAAAAATPVIGGAGWWLTHRGGGIPMDAGAMAVLPFDNNSGDQALAYMSQDRKST